MLQTVAIRNFKAFRDSADFRVAPINLIYGENSSGKSSLIQAILLMKQTLASMQPSSDDALLNFRGDIVDLGGFSAAVNSHAVGASLELQFRASLSAWPLRGRLPFGSKALSYSFEFQLEPETRKTRMAGVRLEDGDTRIRFEYRTKANAAGIFLADAASAAAITSSWVRRLAEQAARRPADRLVISDSDLKWVQDWLKRTPAELSGLIPSWSRQELRIGRPGRPVGGSLLSTRRQVLQQFIYDWQFSANSFHNALAHQFRDIHYIGPLRRAPQRVTLEESTPGRDLGSKGERTLKVLSADPALLESLNSALNQLDIPYALEIRELSGGDESQDIGELSMLSLRDMRSDLRVTLSDVGVGISQVIPVLMQLLLHRRSLVVIEQPELHLHPRLQSKLADIVLYSVQTLKNRVILETHSEHILIRLQRRIRAGQVPGSSINVLYVQQASTGSRVRKLRLNPAGEMLDAWPSGFFDNRLTDLLADDTESATLQRDEE